MADTKEDVVQGAILGLYRVADALTSLSADDQAMAMAAVEKSYRQSARDLGYDDDEAENWTDAMMFRLRNEVTARCSSNQKSQSEVGTDPPKDRSAA